MEASKILNPKRKLSSVSPSQVIAYRECPRKWFWGSVLYDRTPPSRANVRGDAIHKALETYMITGEVLPTVTLPAPYLDKPGETGATETFETLAYLQVAFDHLPPHAKHEFWTQFDPKLGYGVMSEQAGELPTYEGGPSFSQYIDLVHAPEGPEGQITDYKSRSDFRYNKTPAEILEDIQLMANAKWLFAVSDYKTIKIGHLNLLTTGRTKAVPVYVVVTREHVDRIWASTMDTVREMEAHAAIASEPTQLPPNTESCDKYGGCYKKSACGFDKPITIGSLFRKMPTDNSAGASLLSSLLGGAKPAVATPPAGKPDLLSSLLKNNPGPAAPATPVVGVVVPATGTGPDKSIPSSLAALLGKKAEPAPVAPSAAAQAAAVAAGYPETFVPAGGITPPDAPAPTSSAADIAAASGPETPTESDDEAAQETGTATSAPTAEATPAEDGKPRRKRRTKAEMAEARAAEAAGAAVQTPAVQEAIKTVVEKIEAAESAPNVGSATLSSLLNPASAGESEMVSELPEAVEKTDTEAAPTDPVQEQFKERLKTPDSRFGCPVRYIFIDCRPAKGWTGPEVKDAREYWHAFTANAAAAANQADYRFIRYESKGYLAASIRALMRGLPEALYIDSAIPDVQELIAILTPYATLIVQGR